MNSRVFKVWIWLLLGMGCLGSAELWAFDTGVPERLAPGVYVLRGESALPSHENLGRVGNLGFMVGSTGVVVINTGSSLNRARELESAIRTVTDKPIVLVLITHPAQEFLFGNSRFKSLGVPLWASEKTPRLMAERCQHCLETLEQTVGSERMAGTELVLPEGRSFNGETFLIGGRRLRVSEGPAGTVPGNLVIQDVDTGVTFVGALLSVHRIPGVQDTTPNRWIKALSLLEDPSLTTVVPAFGPPVSGRQEIERASQDLKRYLRALDDKTHSLYLGQKKLAEVEALGDLPQFKDWDNYADNHLRNVFYRYLQIESEELLNP